MCKTAKDIWQSLLITHQEESIDSGNARFNTIITSLKALDEGFSSKNYVRKFLRALHPKWRAKVLAIEELKDLSSLALDELIGNLKANEVVMEKDYEIYKAKKERVKSIALKAKKESSDDETSTSGSDDEEYTMAVRNFKKFFRRNGLGFYDSKASTSETKNMSFVGSSAEKATDGSTIKVHGSTLPGSVCLRTCLEPDEWIKDSGCSKHMTGNNSLFSTYNAYDGEHVDNLALTYLVSDKFVTISVKAYSRKKDEFEMSIMGELNFFLGLQIKQMEDRIFFNQSKPDIMFSVCLYAHFQENPKTTHLEAVKRIFRYIRGTSQLRLWYPKGTRIETIVYVDSDHAGNYVDRKSTSSVCTFMRCCLTSWFAKKQTTLAISTTEAEYVSIGKASQQALWMKQALMDYGIRLEDVPI
nr:copia protein [Tanacetum cinerariifolium]